MAEGVGEGGLAGRGVEHIADREDVEEQGRRGGRSESEVAGRRRGQGREK